MRVSNIKKEIDGKNILNGVTFSLNDGDSIGLVGKNGAGKSTLLKILSGNIKPDSGTINLRDDTISYLNQEIDIKYNNYSIIDYLKEITEFKKLDERLHELENNLNESNLEEYGIILNKYLNIDGYSFEDNLKNILSGLNLNKDLNSKIKELSGGEKIKVILASILLKNSDILLLDEPTNNLDTNAIEWLESYLKKAKKKMIIVSHDETFLNNLTNKIYELKDGDIRIYNMSYDDYLKAKELEYSKLKDEYERAQDEKDKLKSQIQRAKEWLNKGSNSKAHNDNDKLANNYAKEKTKSSNISKMTKELNNINTPYFEEKVPIKVFFNFDDTKGNRDISLSNLICGYDDFKTPAINLLIPFGSKISITGSNGSGKTTLIKTILGKIDPISGSIFIGSDARIGYISQNTLENNTNDSILTYLTHDIKEADQSKIFILLDKFNFSYDDRNKSYSTLSPGERTRLNIAKLALNNTNVIILDEVTNHIDIDALNLIYELITSYEGTIISISHNRKYNEKLNPDINLNIEAGEVLTNNFVRKR